jgi:hypothetical protein
MIHDPPDPTDPTDLTDLTDHPTSLWAGRPRSLDGS